MFFHKGQPPAPKGSISRFVMHEYRVNPTIVPVDVLNDSIRAKVSATDCSFSCFLVFDCECLICLVLNKLFSLFQIERFVVCKIVSKAAHPT